MTAEHVGRALRLLLMDDAARRVWEPHVVRQGRMELHYDAVANAIAVSSGGEVGAGRRIRDRIRHALNGERVSRRTLSDFAETFHLSESVQDLLQSLRAEPDRQRGDQLLETLLQRGAGPRQYRTVQLHEVHELGPDGWPKKHATIQTIQSMIEGLNMIDYVYVLGDGLASVDVTHGGTVASTSQTMAGGDMVTTTTIALAHTLTSGEPHELTYVTTFDYHKQPELAFRRGLSPQVETVSILAIFDRARLPMHVWEAEWGDSMGNDLMSQSRVHLSPSEYSVQLLRRHPIAQWIGFKWDWGSS